MKKLYIILFSLFIFLIASNKVMAITEYRIYVTGANSIRVQKGEGSTDFADTSDYSSVLSYSDGNLVLNEGYYFDYIDIGYNNLKITSNNKKVYVNVIGDIDNNSTRSVIIDKLYSEPYISSFTPVVYYTYNGRKYVYSSIMANGDITITDSNIDSRIINPLASSSIQNGSIFSNEGSITIINSNLIAEGGPYATSENTSLTIKNSTIEMLDEYNQGATIGAYKSPVYIEDSNIKSEVSVSLYGGYIKNSTIEQERDGFLLLDDFVVENSHIKSIGARFYSPTKTINISLNDSTFELKEIANVGYTRHGSNNTVTICTSHVTLNNSTITIGENGVVDIANSSSLTLNGSELNTPKVQSNGGTDASFLKLDLSTLVTNSITLNGSVDLTDSSLVMPKDGTIEALKLVSLYSIDDLNIKSIKGGSIDIDDTNFNLSGALIASGDVDISDSTINTHGTRVVGGFTLTDTYYKTLYLNDENTYSPFIVKGDVDIDNSRLIAVSDGTVPAVLVTGNVTLNEGSTFKDDNRKLLTTSNITVSNDNFLSSSSTYGNAEYVSVGDTVKSTTLNNVLTDYAETDGYYEITVKVINGSWEDGTVEDAIVKVLLGDEPDAYLPTSMIANQGYKKGSWKVNDDGEYVYTFIKDAIVNPKTGVASLTGLLVISIFLVVLLNKYKNSFSLFKNI